MEVLSKEDIDNLIESIDFTEYQDRELLSEAEVNQLLQSVTSSEIDENETIPTMAQSMGIKFSKTPTHGEVLDKVNASFGIKQPKRGKLSKLRQGFDAAKVRHSDEFEALLNEKFEVPNELLSKKDIDNLIESVDFTKYQDRELLSKAEVNQLLSTVQLDFQSLAKMRQAQKLRHLNIDTKATDLVQGDNTQDIGREM